MRQKYNAPFLDLHRVDLQRALVQKAEELGVTVKLGERVDAIELEDRTEITCVPSGHKASCDLIVAADGLWSRCRALYTSSDDPPLPTGDLAYRIVLDLDTITDPELRSWVENPTVHFWIGPGAHAVGYSLRGGRAYNIVLLVPDDLSLDATREEGSVEEMMALFQGWDPILTRFLGMVDTVEKWKLMHRKSRSPNVLSSLLLKLFFVKKDPKLTSSPRAFRQRTTQLGQRQVQPCLRVSAHNTRVITKSQESS
jgi:salicylate hydroxylase